LWYSSNFTKSNLFIVCFILVSNLLKKNHFVFNLDSDYYSLHISHKKYFIFILFKFNSMSCLKINLNSYKNEIIQLFQNDIYFKEIASYLLSSYNIHISKSILKHCLKLWNVTKWISIHDSFQLWARISALFFECCVSDKEILYILNKENYQIDKWDL